MRIDEVVSPRLVFRALLAAVALDAAPAAIAQFSAPAPETNIIERINGRLLSAEGAPEIEAGDEVAVFFGDQILDVDRFTDQQADPLAFELIAFGDDPDTEEQEGPPQNAPLTFRFFDASTSTERSDVAAVNDQDETITFRFNGAEAIQFPIDIPNAPPFPDAPSRTVDLVLGRQPASGGNGNGGGGGGDGGGDGGPTFDVDGDGQITRSDAAAVLRLVIGASRAASSGTLDRADVNGDGVVSTQDAIAVMREMRSRSGTPGSSGTPGTP